MGIYYDTVIGLILLITLIFYTGSLLKLQNIMAQLTDFQSQFDSIGASLTAIQDKISQLEVSQEGTLSKADTDNLLTQLTDVATKLSSIATPVQS